jgi:hypothetical protein
MKFFWWGWLAILMVPTVCKNLEKFKVLNSMISVIKVWKRSRNQKCTSLFIWIVSKRDITFEKHSSDTGCMIPKRNQFSKEACKSGMDTRLFRRGRKMVWDNGDERWCLTLTKSDAQTWSSSRCRPEMFYQRWFPFVPFSVSLSPGSSPIYIRLHIFVSVAFLRILAWLCSRTVNVCATSSAPIFSKTKLWMGKYLKESCSYQPSEQCFFKFVSKYVVRFSRRHWLEQTTFSAPIFSESKVWMGKYLNNCSY